jgi:putative sigma-54 modulation protein
MTISIQFVKMPTSEALASYTEKRVQKLATKYSWLINADVSFKMGPDAIKDKVCEIELSLPGPKIFASSKEENFETAVNNTISDLNRQLRKRKETTFNNY